MGYVDGINPNGLAHVSTKSFLGALALNGIVLAAGITAFAYMKMRRYFCFIYEPRSLSFNQCAFKLSSPSYCGRLILV